MATLRPRDTVTRRLVLLGAASVGAVLYAPPPTHAVTRSWSGGSGGLGTSWNTATNWAGGVVPT
jgi:hypothetical protein